jgi:hypothetical protein
LFCSSKIFLVQGKNGQTKDVQLEFSQLKEILGNFIVEDVKLALYNAQMRSHFELV